MLSTLISKIKENYFISYLYLYVFIMPWNFTNGMMGLSSVILLIWWLIIGKKEGYFTKLKNIIYFKPLVLFILFLLWSYLSLLWTEDFEWAEIALKYYNYYWILIPVLMTSITPDEAKKLLYTLIISLGVYALFSLSIALGLVTIINDPSNTNPVSQSNPRGILAYAIVTPYMAITTLSALTIALYSKIKNIKILFYIISFLALIALFLNNGRAGQFGFFMTVMVLFIIYKNYKILLAMLLSIIVAIALLHSTGVLNRTINDLHEIQNPNNPNNIGSFALRAYMWTAAYELIPHHPMIGAGAGDNINEFIIFTKTHPNKATWLRSYHNQHLDTLTKYGIIGYLLLWGSVIGLLYSLRENSQYFTLALIFFSVTFFDAIGDILLLMKPYNNIFMLMFLLFSIIVFYKEEAKRI